MKLQGSFLKSLPESSSEFTEETEPIFEVTSTAEETEFDSTLTIDPPETSSDDVLPEELIQGNIFPTDTEDLTDIDSIIADQEISDDEFNMASYETNATGVPNNVTRDDGVWFLPAASSSIDYSDYAGCLGDEYHYDQTPYGHNGVDFSNGTNAVYATRDGILYYTNHNYSGRGIIVIIKHNNYDSTYAYFSVYQHLGNLPSSITGNANIDQETGVYYKNVSAGELIAYSSNTGGNYGTHLHFAILLAPKDWGPDLANNSKLWAVEQNGWIDSSYIPTNGGRIINNPKDSSDPSWGRIPSSKLAGFTASKGSVTYTFTASEAGGSSTPSISYNRLEFNLNGGAFEEDNTLYKGTAASFSDSYVSGSSIICATPGKNITLTSYASAISVDVTGKVIGALQWQNNGTLTVQEGGFVVAVAQGSNTALYDNIWNAAYNFNNGNPRYVWYDSATKKIYVSDRYIDHGAFAGYMCTQGTSIGITDIAPTRDGFVFGGWLADNGTTYPGNCAVALNSATTTLTAIWNEE